jgi:hypothetical protein
LIFISRIIVAAEFKIGVKSLVIRRYGLGGITSC